MRTVLVLFAAIAVVISFVLLTRDGELRMRDSETLTPALEESAQLPVARRHSNGEEVPISEGNREELTSPMEEESPPHDRLNEEQTLVDARSAIEASVLGVLDPIAILEVAEKLAALDADERAVPEPDVAGALVFPILGTPDGMVANLEVSRSNNPRFKRILCLSMQLEAPQVPYYLDGIWREPPGARIKIWTGHEGEVVAMALTTSAKTDFRESFNRGVDTDGGTFVHGAHYYFDAMDSSKSIARPYGYTGGAFTHMEGEVALERLPPLQKVERLSASMLRMYDSIKQ